MDTQQTVTTLDEVRLAIFRQHTQLAQLLDELEAHANKVLVSGGEGKELRDALDRLTTRFARHLEYEESHLGKWLPAAATGRTGAARERLLGDHDDQRARMRGLVHDRDVFGDARTLSREALAFIHLVRKDMVEEDRKLRELV
jgi:hypothetical protein